MRGSKILIPLDGSRLAEQAIPYAAAAAGPEGEITFFHVVPGPEPLRDLYGGQIASEQDVLGMARETGTALMQETIERWKDVLEVEPKILIQPGEPAEAILSAAGSIGATMLVLASRGRGMAGRIAFGSVADRLSRTSPIPTMIVAPKNEKDAPPRKATISRIIAPFDGSDVAKEALPIVRQIASDTGAPVLLICAVNPASVMLPSPVGAAYYPAELYDEVAEDMQSAAREALEEGEEVLQGLDVTRIIVEGAPANAIQSQLQPGDIVVMTSHGRSGFKRWLLGSVAEKLIRSGAAPVVLVPTKDRIASEGVA